MYAYRFQPETGQDEFEYIDINGNRIFVHCVSDEKILDPGMYFIGQTNHFIRKITKSKIKESSKFQKFLQIINFYTKTLILPLDEIPLNEISKDKVSKILRNSSFRKNK